MLRCVFEDRSPSHIFLSCWHLEYTTFLHASAFIMSLAFMVVGSQTCSSFPHFHHIQVLAILLWKIYQACLHYIVCFFLLLSLSHFPFLSPFPPFISHYTEAAAEKVENAYKFSYSLSSESVNQSSWT